MLRRLAILKVMFLNPCSSGEIHRLWVFLDLWFDLSILFDKEDNSNVIFTLAYKDMNYDDLIATS